MVWAVSYVAYCLNKLGFVTPSLTETMLVISKDAVRVKIIHDRAVDYVFEEFTRDACKRDRTVVSNINFVGFFLKGA